ncbi:hypothetical protein ACSSS7_000570 [Eimeria intestinalis]
MQEQLAQVLAARRRRIQQQQHQQQQQQQTAAPCYPTVPCLYTSHEAILLGYEEALTRIRSSSAWALAGSAHFLWIGDRTRHLDGAHVEFCRGILNPLGIKIGPSAIPDEVVAICKKLNPENQPGKLSLITRLGKAQVETKLPPIVNAVSAAGIRVLWVCDPMHGNTLHNLEGGKERHFSHLLDELKTTVSVLSRLGHRLGGLHLELTGEDVLECVGGPQNPQGPPLTPPFCDPLLNYQQSIEVKKSRRPDEKEGRLPEGQDHGGPFKVKTRGPPQTSEDP